MNSDPGIDSIRCPMCGLVQFSSFSTICKRCRRSLGIRYTTFTFSCKNLGNDRRSEKCSSAFGQMLRALRLERGMTQAECAIHLETSRSHLSRLESGRLSPSFFMLVRAARAFAVDRVILRLRVPTSTRSKA